MRFWILNNIITTHRLKETVACLNGDRKKWKVVFRQCFTQVLSACPQQPPLRSCSAEHLAVPYLGTSVWVTGHLGMTGSDCGGDGRRELALCRGSVLLKGNSHQPPQAPLWECMGSLGWWWGMWEAEPQVWLLGSQHHCSGFVGVFFVQKLNGAWVQEIPRSFCSHRFAKAHHGLSKLLVLCSWPFEDRRSQKMFFLYLAENHLLLHSWKEWGFCCCGNVLNRVIATASVKPLLHAVTGFSSFVPFLDVEVHAGPLGCEKGSSSSYKSEWISFLLKSEGGDKLAQCCWALCGCRSWMLLQAFPLTVPALLSIWNRYR